MYLCIYLYTANTRGIVCIYVSIYIQLIPEAEYVYMYLCIYQTFQTTLHLDFYSVHGVLLFLFFCLPDNYDL